MENELNEIADKLTNELFETIKTLPRQKDVGQDEATRLFLEAVKNAIMHSIYLGRHGLVAAEERGVYIVSVSRALTTDEFGAIIARHGYVDRVIEYMVPLFRHAIGKLAGEFQNGEAVKRHVIPLDQHLNPSVSTHEPSNPVEEDDLDIPSGMASKPYRVKTAESDVMQNGETKPPMSDPPVTLVGRTPRDVRRLEGVVLHYGIKELSDRIHVASRTIKRIMRGEGERVPRGKLALMAREFEGFAWPSYGYKWDPSDADQLVTAWKHRNMQWIAQQAEQADASSETDEELASDTASSEE